MTAQTLITVSQLEKTYGARKIVDGVSFQIQENEVLAIIGPNGAGKSTTLDMILGLRKPDTGKVQYWCAEPKKHMGVQLQSTPFFPSLNALENLQLFASFYKVRLSNEKAMNILRTCGLETAAKTDASRLSGGQQKRLAISLTLVHEPKVIFLDEPTAALDPRSRFEIREVIRNLKNAGVTVVFTSHDMEEVGRLADRVMFIVEGRLRASGTPREICEDFGLENLDELFLRGEEW